MKIQIAFASSARVVYKVYCFRRLDLDDVPHEGISLGYLKTKEPRWTKTVSVPSNEIAEFLERYDMPKNGAFLYFAENLKQTVARATSKYPDWKE